MEKRNHKLTVVKLKFSKKEFKTIECPFCGDFTSIETISFHAVGRKCNTCQAIHKKDGFTYKYK